METTTNTSSDIDLVFCCDCTSSMGSYIESAKKNIRKISEDMHATEKRNMQYGLVCYRDHPPQDSTYATKVFPLTPSIKTMQQSIDTMEAQGGGDGPESVACALNDVLNLDWRKNSVRICVVIADAPPHGIGATGDGFPNGCPCGIDPLVTARKMAENNIIIYSVACEPSLGRYNNARAFFKGISEITSGRYLSLGNAHLLPQVIVGGSAEEADLQKFEEEVLKETENVKTTSPTPLTDAEVEEHVSKNLAAKGCTTWHLDVTHQAEVIDGFEYFSKNTTLNEARNEARNNAPSKPASASASAPRGKTYASDGMPTSYATQEAKYHQSAISTEQVSRILKKKK